MSDERLKNLGLNIKFARIRAKISQENLAERVGVSRETISMIENGNQNASFLKILDIVRVIDAPFDEIVKDV